MYFEGVCVLYRSSKRYHMKRWKSEMLQNYLENTWLDGRNAANSVQIRGWTSEMLQIACKTEGLGHHLGTHTMRGGARITDHGTIHTYTYVYIHIHTYTYIYISIHIHTYTYLYILIHTYTYIYTNRHTYTYTYTYICIHKHFLRHIHNSNKYTRHRAFGLCRSSCINLFGNFCVGVVPCSQGYVGDSYNFHFYGNSSAEMLEPCEF